MNRPLVSLVAGLALLSMSSIVLADDQQSADSMSHHTLADLSVPLLQEGLKTTTMCATTEAYGVRRFVQFYNANKDDTTATGSPAGNAEEAATDDFDQMITDANLAAAFAKGLVAKGMKEQDVTAAVQAMATKTRDDLASKYDAIETMEEFEPAFKQTSDACIASLHDFVGRVKTFIDSLDAKQGNH